MSRHHPKNATLVEFAAGTLDEGRSLVIAAHLSMCGACRRFVSALEEVGGQLLDQAEPVAMSKNAATRVLNRLAGEPLQPTREPLAAWAPDQDILLDYGLGPWRWVSPGLHYRAVKLPSANGSRVFMLRANPGMKLPAHKHTGTELTCVLKGAFIHEGGRFAAGDCDDADQDDKHSPLIDEGEECVCLVAMQGQIRFTSTLGRLIQPLIRF